MIFPQKPKLYLFVDETMSLSVFLELLKKCPKGIQLYVQIIERWQFIHTITGVKQIKEASENIEIFISTKDSIGKKLLESVNIPGFEGIPEDVKDYFDEVSPEKRFECNRIGEAFQAQEYEVVKIIRESGEEQVTKVYHEVKGLPLRTKILMGFLTLISIGVLSFLIALVMPSATITVTTDKKLVESVVNTNFIKTNKSFTQYKQGKDNNFYLYPLELRFEHSFDFPVLSKVFEGQNAFGDIRLYNNYNEDITLRNGTKIQTQDGLIFLSKHYVRIPAKKAVKTKDGKIVMKPGEALVNVRANDLDMYDEVIGSRGNIPAQKFSIPGLTFYMQKFVWGESKEAFRGGTTRWRIEVQQKDVDAAKEKMKNILLAIAREQIEKYINEQNMQLPKKIALFPLEDYIKAEITKIDVPNILGQSIQIFPVKGQMLVSAYVFHQKDFYDFLTEHIKEKVDPNMKLDTIDFATMALRKFNETPSEIRLTVDVQGRQSYEISENTEYGKKFQELLREEIHGIDKNEALKIVSNRPEISTANISIWPPIKTHLPLIKGNIKVLEK